MLLQLQSSFHLKHQVGNLAFLYCLNLKKRWINESVTSIIIQSTMSDLLSNWLGTKWFHFISIRSCTKMPTLPTLCISNLRENSNQCSHLCFQEDQNCVDSTQPMRFMVIIHLPTISTSASCVHESHWFFCIDSKNKRKLRKSYRFDWTNSQKWKLLMLKVLSCEYPSRKKGTSVNIRVFPKFFHWIQQIQWHKYYI